MFFLLIPFAIIFALTLIYLIISLINKNLNWKKALFVFSILPIFILSQLSSDFVFDRIQRFRIKKAIVGIEKEKNNTGDFPDHIDLKMGIEYTAGENGYGFKYSRGFLETVRYNSTDKEFVVYGWND